MLPQKATHGPDIDPAEPKSTPKDDLALMLGKTLDEYRKDRRYIEQRWVADELRYRGEYGPDVNIPPDRSKVYIRLARKKTSIINARLYDLEFPSGDQNWRLSGRHITLDPGEAAQYAMSEPDLASLPVEEIEKELNARIDDAAEKMSLQIERQHKAGGYQEACRAVIQNGHYKGIGILKGPVIDVREQYRWQKNPETGQWEKSPVEESIPVFESVDPWDYYPDLSAKTKDGMEGEFQLHTMTRADLQELAEDPSVDSQRIRDLLRSYPDGLSERREFQGEREGGSDLAPSVKTERGKFDIAEYWGYVPAYMMARCLCNHDREDMAQFDDDGSVVAATVLFAGGIALKAELTPVWAEKSIFHTYVPMPDMVFPVVGESFLHTGSEEERAANACIRAALDNAAASAVLTGEYNTDLIDPAELWEDGGFQAGKWYAREGKGVEAQYQAIRAIQFPSYVQQYMGLAEYFRTMLDEMTTPSYMGGTPAGSGAAKTVGGLSMLMGAANIEFKDLARIYEDTITESSLKALIDYNMVTGDEAAKADISPVPLGVTSLVAKEVQANSLLQFMGAIDPNDDRINLMEIYRALARVLELPKGVLRDEEYMDMLEQREMLIEQLSMAVVNLVQSVQQGVPISEEVLNVVNQLIQGQGVPQ